MQPKATAAHLVDFLNFAVTPFHAVKYWRDRLAAAGFSELQERERWSLTPGLSYFFTRNETAIYAFRVGAQFSPDTGSFRAIGAHTDSPCLKLAPHSADKSCHFERLNVQLYGGGLWHTWFDRDLTLAGRVIVETGQGLESRLVHIRRPILRVPNLAIHLSSNRDNFEFNKESHLKPLLATEVAKAIALPAASEAGLLPHQSDVLMALVSKELNIAPAAIKGLELSVVDAQPAALIGAYEEWVSSGRLDNLTSTFCALEALEQSGTEGTDVCFAAAFDNEECGSDSMQGAGSAAVEHALRRIHRALDPSPDGFEACLRRSFFISADMAHGQHPNYPEKHQSAHAPQTHKGVVIKTNANQRYATDVYGAAVIRKLAEIAGIPTQEFIVRNDSSCGSTIGPILACKTGVRVVDIGAPQLPMHSIREMMGSDDVFYYEELMKAFFKLLPQATSSASLN